MMMMNFYGFFVLISEITYHVKWDDKHCPITHSLIHSVDLYAGCEYEPCTSELVILAGTYSQLLINGQLTATELMALCMYVTITI